MNSESGKVQQLEKNISETFNHSEDCKASNASTEIMLYRFCDGKEIEFPF